MSKILTIDLGTTYFKFALFDRAGQPRHTVRCATPVQEPEAGRMELDAGEFQRVLADGIGQLARLAGGLGDVELISFATQTNSFLLLGADDIPLTPIILWPDRRAAGNEETIRAHSSLAGFTATTGVPGLSVQFVPAKLRWLQLHAHREWQRMCRFCLISDYLTLLFTGHHVTEAGAAGLTALVDVRRCRWWPEALSLVQLDVGYMPEIVRSGTDLGVIRPAAAAVFGLPQWCRFVVGCLDQYAGAIGAGNVVPGLVSETTGTVLATVCCADHVAENQGPTVFQGPGFAADRFYRMAFGDVSANYLEWYRDTLTDHPDFDALTALAANIEPGAGGLRLRTGAPLTVPKEVFAGLTPRHTRGHAVRCILEAVAWALRDQVLALSDGAPPEEIRAAGGGARSSLWLQIKADVMGVPFTPPRYPEPASLGAAILAEVARSQSSVESVAQAWVKLGTPHPPNLERHRRYQALSSALA